MRSRSERIQFASTATKQLRISVQGEGVTWTGTAWFEEASHDSVSRQITARTCDEVVEGLALVTVMVLDPEAMQRTNVETAPVEPPSPTRAKPPPGVPAKPKTNPLIPADIPGHFLYGIDAIFAAISGPAPDVLYGVGGSLHASWVKPHSAFSPKLRLSLAHSVRNEFGARGGVANFTLDTASLSFCPVALRVGDWGARPCVGGVIGRLTAAGTRTFVPVTEHLGWAEANALVEIVWNPTRYLELFVAPGLGLALRRYSFSFLPYQFYVEPPVMLSGTAGVGLQFE